MLGLYSFHQTKRGITATKDTLNDSVSSVRGMVNTSNMSFKSSVSSEKIDELVEKMRNPRERGNHSENKTQTMEYLNTTWYWIEEDKVWITNQTQPLINRVK
ncbi:hypothetical protein AKJ59_00685 [candidate division MSBL1 archaeon SCGC-AAA385M02]|uniref:Uncharacterized protein n=1 Tax=candidate division MSBL1 archaeon SCGC-AAA385M02 TaxID=1698287 RepID=A0A133VQB8_9EURY|nr:hypothetical protein AKJ59_00685 [candidate division MSBL1 archaeon SCGC-AAA385M02]